MEHPIPLADEQSAGPDGACLRKRRGLIGAGLGQPVESADARRVQVAVHLRLQPIGQDPQQEMLWQVRWGAPPEHAAPAGLEPCKVETAQAPDLILEWCVLVSHGISRRWTDLKPLGRC